MSDEPKPKKRGGNGKPFVKGDPRINLSGLPGRPKSRNIMRGFMNFVDQGGRKDELNEIIWNLLKEGNPTIWRELLARYNGPMPTQVNIKQVTEMTDDELLERAAELGLYIGTEGDPQGDPEAPEE